MRISDWSSDVCSSDLPGAGAAPRRSGLRRGPAAGAARGALHGPLRAAALHRRARDHGADAADVRVRRTRRARSEEHTSELQSLMRISYAVFCLKKKKNNKRRYTCTHIPARQETKIKIKNAID